MAVYTEGNVKVLPHGLVRQASGTLGDVWRLIKLEGCVASTPMASFKEMGQVQVDALIGR